MPIIEVETIFNAPAEKCFDLARDIDVHMQTTGSSGERAIAGVTSGKMGLHDVVTFEAKHFGVRHRLTSKIVEFDRPNLFTDQMVDGPFKRPRHEHRFVQTDHGTRMVDVMDFASPLGPIGACVDHLVLARYMARFLAERGTKLKQIAESA